MTFVNYTKIFASVAGFLFVTACAQLDTQPTTPLAAEPTATIAKEPLNGESMFQLFLAEIATNRRELGAAAALYGEVSKNHNDVAAISRAVALNQAVGNYTAMQAQTEKWIFLRPNDPLALSAHSVSSVANGQLDAAATSLKHWLAADENADISLILPAVKNLEEDQIRSLNTQLIALQTEAPKSANLLYTRARLEFVLDHPKQALALCEQSLDISQNTQVELFKFQLLVATNNIADAKKTIERLNQQQPMNRQVAIHYARFLYQFDAENLTALKQLHSRFSMDPAISRTYARSAFEQGDLDSAQAVFLHLQEQSDSDEAHYFLGRIDAINGNLTSAENHFKQIQTQPYLQSALAEWVGIAQAADEQRLLAHFEQVKIDTPELSSILWRLEASFFQITEQPMRARQTLDAAIKEHPEDIPLLYDHAMLAAQFDQLDVMESSLSAILTIDPNHIDSLNALGYTWADQNKNLDLASQYIEMALQTDPENPAYQDSKGWYLYRMGELNDALAWLEKAYTQLENDEVAAHIAEVLWHLNRLDDARNYLNEIARLNPNSKYLKKLNDLFNQ